MELRPFTFLSESRFRELKQRWGQVFRADMGAEAFYDILRRLDLDKLSEELWVRGSHFKEQAEAQESHHSFEGCGSVPPLKKPP
jgi:DNA-directed RNA polymerase subunit beta'